MLYMIILECIHYKHRLHWILLKDSSNPMWFMAMSVFSYSLVGLVLMCKQKLISRNTVKVRG